MTGHRLGYSWLYEDPLEGGHTNKDCEGRKGQFGDSSPLPFLCSLSLRRLCSDGDGERKEAEEDEEKEEEEDDDGKEKKLMGTPKHDEDAVAPGDYDGDGAEDGSAGE